MNDYKVIVINKPDEEQAKKMIKELEDHLKKILGSEVNKDEII